MNTDEDFASVDPIMSAWAAAHGLHLQSTYKDCEVRSVEVVSRDGRSRVQIWVELPEPGAVIVHVWDYGSRHETILDMPQGLRHALEDAHRLAMGILGGRARE